MVQLLFRFHVQSLSVGKYYIRFPTLVCAGGYSVKLGNDKGALHHNGQVAKLQIGRLLAYLYTSVSSQVIKISSACGPQ